MVGLALLGLIGDPGSCAVGIRGLVCCGLLVHMLPPYFDPNQELYRAGSTCIHGRMSLQVVAILISRRIALLRNCPLGQPEQGDIHCALASVENSLAPEW